MGKRSRKRLRRPVVTDAEEATITMVEHQDMNGDVGHLQENCFDSGFWHFLLYNNYDNSFIDHRVKLTGTLLRILWGWDSLVVRASDCHRGKSWFVSRLVLLSKALYHACFIWEQRCKWWSCLPKVTSWVITDVKSMIYIRIFIYSMQNMLVYSTQCSRKTISAMQYSILSSFHLPY